MSEKRRYKAEFDRDQFASRRFMRRRDDANAAVRAAGQPAALRVNLLPWLYDCGSVLAAANVPLVLGLFLAGLAGSLTHCATMCSTFVLGQSEGMAGRNLFTQLLLPYHAGRLVTYAALGAVVGFGFHFVSASPAFIVVRHFLLTLVGLTFLAVFAERALIRFGIALPLVPVRKPKCAVSAMSRVRSTRGPLARFGLGVALGFLPCPMVFAALMVVAAKADPVGGALAMAAFAAGTMPVLMGLGVAGFRFLNKRQRTRQAITLAALGVNGVVLLTLAFG
jgi:sulfite exporter TauE/SafE